MTLTRFRARGFRNLEDSELCFPARVAVLIGNNAQGKTNFLEAVHVLSNLRSFRTRRVGDLLGPNEEAARLEGRVDGSSGPVDLAVMVTNLGRRALRQGSTPASAAEYLLSFPSVFFGPGDLDLSEGDQDLRRAYADRAAFLWSPNHLGRMREYGRALKQRNALLRRPGADLTIWDEQLAEAGARIRQARQAALEGLRPHLVSLHEEISGGRDRLEVSWTPEARASDGRSLREEFLESLARSRPRDRELGFTTQGPHRDRLSIEVNGHEVRHHGSRGQHRTAALTFKLALLRWSADQAGEAPAFLVDDPAPELDPPRLAYLATTLSEWPGQVLLTCTDASIVPFSSSADVALYRVESGRIRIS
ncbi:MAG: DNA replication and repair protein RecF [Deltaproteobacteria bacterium]|nr:DNA replication and repair protein RecF [Deltaproteobacteria bacterium]